MLAKGWRSLLVKGVAPLLLCGVGIAFVGGLWRGRIELGRQHINDFTSILAGAYLVGTPGLYDVSTNLELQKRLVGEQDTARVFPRWPYVGLAMRPLAAVPYATALQIWHAIILACCASFVFLFPLASWQSRALAVCWSIPAADAFSQGQDGPVLLIVLSLTLRLWRNNYPLLAGVMISLCASKYHLLVLIPILIVRQKQWRFLFGGVLGGLGLIGISTLVQGPGWVAAHLANVRRPEIDSYPWIMPNFRGISGERFGLEITLALVLAAWLVYVTPTVSFEAGLGLVLAGGLLVSHHAYLHDCVLLIPAFLAIADFFPSLRSLMLVFLSPLPTISYHTLLGAKYILVGSVVTFLLLVAIEGTNKGEETPPEHA